MVKRLFGIALLNLLLLGATAFAQQPEAATGKSPAAATGKSPEAAIIKAEAENSSRAFMNGDFGKLLDSTYPKLIELGGGREKVLSLIEGQMKEMRDEGMKIIAYTMGEPEPSVRAGAKLVAILPLKLRMESREYKMELSSFWLAVSTDEGKSWKFISGSSLNSDTLKLVLPEAVGKIKLPVVEQPSRERKPAN